VGLMIPLLSAPPVAVTTAGQGDDASFEDDHGC
jgi:hypothetical protein